MTFERECFVYIVLPGETDFVTAARFRLSQTRDGTMIGELIYGKNYLARHDALELDPIELRLSQTQYQTARMNGFFGAIRDAMPDYWGRKVIDHSVVGKHTEFDYLMLGPDDRAGALGFGLNVTPPAPRRIYSQTLDLGALQKVAEIIINDGSVEQITNRAELQQIQALLLEGTSMGGARPKAVVEDGNALWIAKFSAAQDRWNQPVVEHAMLMLAKACGLHVAESKLTSVAGKDVLLVKRFDREQTQKKNYYRYRMISALTLLKSDEDPLLRHNWSYLLLADEIRRIASNPKADLYELFARMCFNAVISNLDDHPRNHAIIAKRSQWQLSPAYDLTPTPSVAQDTRLLAMSCGIHGRLAQRENLLSAHARFMLSKEEAETILNKMLAVVRDWRKYLRRAGASEKDCEAVASAFIYEGFFNSLEE